MMKNGLKILMISILAVMLPGCEKEVPKLNQQAIDQLKAGDLAGAETSLKDAIRLDPTNRTLRKNLVEVYFRQGDWARAIQLLESTREIAGLESDIELRTNLAEAYIMSGDTVLASSQIRDLLSEDPENEYLLYLDGVTATSPSRAIQSLNKAIEMNPDRKESYLALAKAHSFDADTQAALETLDRVVEKFGSTVEVPLQKISLHLRENDFEMANKELASLKEEFGEVPVARLYEAYLAVADRRVEEALEIFESLDGEEGLTEQARLGQSLCHLIEGDPNAAIELCEEVLKENETATVALNLQGLGQLKRLQRFLAKQSFQDSLEKNPNQPTIRALAERIGN